MNFEQLKWTVRHEIALYFAPASGATKGIRRAYRGQQVKRAGVHRSLAPMLWIFNGIRREYRLLERLAERRRTKRPMNEETIR